MQSVMQKLQAQNRDLETKVSVTVQEKSQAIREAEANFARQHGDSSRALEEIKALQKEKTDLMERINELQDEKQGLQRKIESSDREIEDLEGNMRELNEELDQLKMDSGQQEDVGLFAQRGLIINTKLIEAQDKIDELKSSLKNSELSVRDLTRKLATETQASQRKIELLEGDLSSLKKNLASIKDALRTKEDECSKLLGNIDAQIKKRTDITREKDEEIKRLENEVVALQDERALIAEEYDKSCEELQQAKAENERINAEWTELQGFSDELQEEVFQLKFEKEDLELNFNMLQDEVASTNESKTELQRTQTSIIVEKQQKITDLEKKNKSLSSELSDAQIKMGSQLQQISSLESRLYLAQQKEKDAQAALVKLQSQPVQVVTVLAPAPAPIAAVPITPVAAPVPIPVPAPRPKTPPFVRISFEV
jgi:chromosome segregation ATPase